MSDVQQLAVLGCGQMGIGIAFVAAVHARVPRIVLVDISVEQAERGRASLEEQLRKAAKYRRIEPRLVGPILDGVHVVHSIEELASAHAPDLVIEAASEDMSVKQRLFHELAQRLPLHTLLVSNTSALSITALARAAADAYTDAAEAATSAARVRLRTAHPRWSASTFSTRCR